MLTKSPLERFIIPRYRERIDDSKKLLASQREKAFCEISQKALFKVGLRHHKFIDKKNIYAATLFAMRHAVSGLVKEYCRANNKKEKNIRKDICVLLDGNMKLGLPYRTVPILKGDRECLSIAAASIVAKVTRDKIMCRYDKKYPLYGFSKHKGYGTRLHLEAIEKYGPCPIHRQSFAPMRYTNREQDV